MARSGLFPSTQVADDLAAINPILVPDQKTGGTRSPNDSHHLLLLYIGIIAAWPVWWAGYCWGPPPLTEILAPLMAILAIGLVGAADTSVCLDVRHDGGVLLARAGVALH